MSNFSFTLNEHQPWTKFVKFGNEYDNNVYFEGVGFIYGPHLVIIHIGKIRASNGSYARKMNIISIITHFVNLLRCNAIRCKKPGSNCSYSIFIRK